MFYNLSKQCVIIIIKRNENIILSRFQMFPVLAAMYTLHSKLHSKTR